MRVRAVLAFRIDAFARVLYETSGLAQAPVGSNGKNRNAAATVVRHEKEFALLVEDQMARARTHRSTLIQERQLSRGFDGERTDRARGLALKLSDFIHRKEQPTLDIEFEEGRILALGRQSQGNQCDVL